MTILVWLAIGAVALTGLSVLVGLAIAIILGRIGEEVSRLLGAEQCAVAPMMRAMYPREAVLAERIRSGTMPSHSR